MKRILSSALPIVLALSLLSCKKGDNNNLSHSYTGVLSVEYSKGFPDFTAKAKLNVGLDKSGVFTFTGNGDMDEFDEEDILYEDGKPVTKIRMAGTLMFNGAQGDISISGEDEFAMIKVSANLYVQMIVWAWDDELGWIQMMDELHTQQDQYSDGAMQFNILHASSLNGQDIKSTLPDIQGTFTYGYNLTLIPLLDD